jgi:hypothetical protein
MLLNEVMLKKTGLGRITPLAATLAMSAMALQAATFGPGDQLVLTFTAAPNTADLLLLFSNDPLAIVGTPVFTTNLYNGQTLLGTYSSRPFVFNGVSTFTVAFAAPGGGSGASINNPVTVPFTSITNGTIAGRLVTTVSGGSVTGFNASDVVLYDATSVTNGFRPLGDVVTGSLTLQTNPALPHLAAGDTWTTGIFVINTAPQAANFSIAFHDDNGNPVALPFTTGSTSILSGTIPPVGSAYFEAGNAQAPLKTGWGQVSADPSIVVQGLFRDNVSGTYYEAAVPSSPGSKAFEVPFDTTTFAPTNAALYTGLAIANLDPSQPANVTCVARDSSGNPIPNSVTVPTIAPLGHWANYLFPALAGQRGTIDCTSTTSVGVVALRFIGTTAFSSLPVILK